MKTLFAPGVALSKQCFHCNINLLFFVLRRCIGQVSQFLNYFLPALLNEAID